MHRPPAGPTEHRRPGPVPATTYTFPPRHRTDPRLGAQAQTKAPRPRPRRPDPNLGAKIQTKAPRPKPRRQDPNLGAQASESLLLALLPASRVTHSRNMKPNSVWSNDHCGYSSLLTNRPHAAPLGVVRHSTEVASDLLDEELIARFARIR